MTDFLLPLFAYLMGSISSAILTARALGLPDPRTVGSGNPGATNVLRHGGKKAALITLVGDILKGVVPVLVARLLGTAPTGIAWVLFAAFVGHLYPVFFGFRGGKGVATAFGAISAAVPQVGGLLVLTWALMALTFRYSSLAAVTAALAAPVYMLWLPAPRALFYATTVVTLMLVWRHRSNIRNLVDGKEDKIAAGP